MYVTMTTVVTMVTIVPPPPNHVTLSYQGYYLDPGDTADSAETAAAKHNILQADSGYKL